MSVCDGGSATRYASIMGVFSGPVRWRPGRSDGTLPPRSVFRRRFRRELVVDVTRPLVARRARDLRRLLADRLELFVHVHRGAEHDARGLFALLVVGCEVERGE